MKRLLLSSAVALCAQLSYAPAIVAADITAASIAADISSPSLSEQDKLFAAIDAGNLPSIKAHVDFVRAFLEINPDYNPAMGISLEFKDANGNTPLIRAAQQKNVNVVGYLLNNGANINAVNTSAETALVVAYRTENPQVARYLLSRGAVDPLHIAQQLKEDRKERQAAADTQNLILAAGSAVVIGGALVAAGGSGDGGLPGSNPLDPPPDGTIHPQDVDPSTYHDSQWQASLTGIKSDYARGHGYDGSIYDRNSDGTLASYTPTGYVYVAVLDTGINLTHTDLNANILTSRSFTCLDSGCVAGGGATGDHGTWVAGVIAAEDNGTGVVGVAPQAKILSIGFADSGGSLTNGDIPGIQKAIDNGAQVINGSYGFTGLSATSGNAATIASLVNSTIAGTDYKTVFENGVTQHVIFVFSTGNEGQAQPVVPAGLPVYFQGATPPAGILQGTYDSVNPTHLDWSKNWVAAASVDASNTISSFSNRCGAAMNWCLSAPGEDITSTDRNGGYQAGLAGTSFSAPNITGAIAVMLGAWPHLSAEKVLDILFQTATDLGDPGVDAVYGWGLLNLQAATDPSDGGWALDTGVVSSMSLSMPFDISGFGLSAPFGNALIKTTFSLQFIDSWGKNYTIPLSALSENLTQAKTTLDKFQQFAGNEFQNVMTLGENTRVSFSTTPDPKIQEPDRSNTFGKASYVTAMNFGQDTASIGINYQTNLAMALLSQGSNQTVLTDTFKNPFINLLDSANSSIASYRRGNNRMTVAAYSGRFDNNEYEYRFGSRKRVNGFYSEATYKDAGATLSLNSGMMDEKNSLLGSEMSGAFAIDKATTYHGGASGEVMLADNIALMGSYSMGLTQVTAAGNSLFTHFGTITTNAFSAGLERRGANDNDRLGVAVSQPLRVTSGHAALNLPVALTSDGMPVFSHNSLNLAPTARELDFETYYGITLSETSELDFNGMFRLNPNNSNAPGTDTTVMAKYKLSF